MRPDGAGAVAAVGVGAEGVSILSAGALQPAIDIAMIELARIKRGRMNMLFFSVGRTLSIPLESKICHDA